MKPLGYVWYVTPGFAAMGRRMFTITSFRISVRIAYCLWSHVRESTSRSKLIDPVHAAAFDAFAVGVH
jgi:hypothetical protein